MPRVAAKALGGAPMRVSVKIAIALESRQAAV